MGFLSMFNDYSEPERGIFWHRASEAEGNWQGIPGIVETFKVTKPAVYQKIQLQPLRIFPDRSELVCPQCESEYKWDTHWKFCKQLKCAEILEETTKCPNHPNRIEFKEGVWQ